MSCSCLYYSISLYSGCDILYRCFLMSNLYCVVWLVNRALLLTLEVGEVIGILITSVSFDTGGDSNGFHIYAAIDKQATIRMMK